MAIELPDELLWVMDLLGLNWPQVNEDKVAEFAGHVRQFAKNIDRTHESATSTIRQMADAYQADSYQQLVERWAKMSSDHMTELVEVCGTVAIVLEVAADAIIAAKMAVITELGIMAAEFVADQAAAVATLGAAEAAEAVLIEATKKVVNGILQQFEQQIIGDLTGKAVGPLADVVERAAGGLVFEGVQAALAGGAPVGAGGGGGSSSSFQIHPEQLLQHAARLHEHADEVAGHASTFAAATAGVSFS